MCVLDDDQFQLVMERCGPKPKGRLAHLPSLPVNNLLLLQLNMLKNRGRTWAEVQDLFDHICRHQTEPVPPCDVVPLIRTCLRQLTQVKPQHVEDFLRVDKAIAWIGPFSKQYCMSRAFLLSDTRSCQTEKLDNIPVGLLLELEIFRASRILD